MPDRPLIVHCSGLGGGLLSPDHEYDIFFQNHAQLKVYGPSLAMTDDWEHCGYHPASTCKATPSHLGRRSVRGPSGRYLKGGA